jgi:hypothetical protein
LISRRINQRIASQGSDWLGILSIYSAEHDTFSDVNWATTMSKLGRVAGRDRTQMKRSDGYRAFVRDLSLKMTASPDLRHFALSGGVQAISNIMHAFAKLKVPTKDKNIAAVLSTVDSNSKWIVEAAVEKGYTQAISNTAWAFATLDVPAPSLFKKIDERASFLVDNGNPQNIANTAWAFATLNISAPSLFKKIDDRSSSLVENGDLRHISNTAWAFATLNVSAPSLFKKIDERASFFVENGKPQDIANTAWALATLYIQAPSVF